MLEVIDIGQKNGHLAQLKFKTEVRMGDTTYCWLFSYDNGEYPFHEFIKNNTNKDMDEKIFDLIDESLHGIDETYRQVKEKLEDREYEIEKLEEKLDYLEEELQRFNFRG